MRIILITVVLFGINASLTAQTLNGKVISENGKPILDVYVLYLSNNNPKPNPVEEIHFTPGTPFFLRASIQYNF